MNKQEFLAHLKEELSGLPEEDIAERVTFYSEMIDDRIEDGLSEEAATAEIGPTEKIISQIMEEIPLNRLFREKMKPKRQLQAWEIILLILCSPIWLSLLISAFVLILSVFIVMWAVVISLWAVFASFIVCSFAGLAAGNVLIWRGEMLHGILMISAGFVLGGLSIFLFFGCRTLTKGAASLTKKIPVRIKSLFLGKGNQK